MNAPSQTLICNSQIEWSKLPNICLLSAFPRLFAPPLLDLLQVDLTRSLASFSSRAILNRTKEFLEGNSFVCVRVFDREKMLKVGGKKEKKRKRERKKRKKHTNSIARIRAGASPPAVSFTCLKLHHAAPRKQDTFDRRISCHDHATHLWKRNTSHTVWEANKDKEVKLIVQISFAEKIKFKEEGSVTFQNFFLQ